jgi:hypothetical protein
MAFAEAMPASPGASALRFVLLKEISRQVPDDIR